MVYDPFKISVSDTISRRQDDNKRLSAMETCLRMEQILSPAGFEPVHQHRSAFSSQC